MRSLWQEADSAHERHARLILTAGAAGRIPVTADLAADAANLVASMLSAGMDREAARWGPIVRESGDDRAWALLALGSPRPSVDLGTGRIETFIGADDSAGRRALADAGRRARRPRPDRHWQRQSAGSQRRRRARRQRRLGRRHRSRRPQRRAGTVALLAGIGMQSVDWYGVPPVYLFKILRSLSMVGHGL